MILGDSYTQPTVVDNGGHAGYQGYPQILGYLLGAEIISCGQGGAGYITAGTGSPSGAYTAYLADAISLNPDEIWLAGGLNDRNNVISAGTAAGVQTACASMIATIRVALPTCKIVVMGPFWTQGNQATANVAIRDAIKAAATAVPGVTFFDPMVQTPLATTSAGVPAATTLSAASSTGSNQITVPTSIPRGYVQLGGGITDLNAEVLKISSVSGSGPYTITLTANPSNPHPAGTAVTPAGPDYLTGRGGYQGNETGTGNSDIYTGSDGTHPTVRGHKNLAIALHTYYSATLGK